MKRLFFVTIFLALIMAVPIPTMAMGRVDVGVSIPLPPPIGFAEPPEMVVIPETYIYVVPDSDEDIFFYNGWWWRPWNGRWYRSHYYNSGWGYYEGTPSFYVSVPSGWRNDYRQRRWRDHEWNYQRLPQQQVQQNWQGWERDRHWEKQNTWGVQGLKPQTRTRQPSEAVQPKPQERPQSRDIQQQKFQPQSQPVKRQVRETQTREFQQQQYKPQTRDIQKQQLPQTRELQQQRQRTKSQPVKRKVRKEAKPQQSNSQQEKPERGQGEKQDRR